MANLDIIRAWKDPEYRLSLSAAELAQLPPHPAGLIELEDAALAHVPAYGFGLPTVNCPPPQTGGLCPTMNTECPTKGYKCAVTGTYTKKPVIKR
jgi:mersacidin/lichenicidin family type 2 lantibiotic